MQKKKNNVKEENYTVNKPSLLLVQSVQDGKENLDIRNVLVENDTVTKPSSLVQSVQDEKENSDRSNVSKILILKQEHSWFMKMES